MEPKFVYESAGEIPEQHRKLYVEKDGKWVINLDGMRTDDDIKGLKSALESERDANKTYAQQLKEFKDKLKVLEELGGDDGIKTLKEMQKRLSEDKEAQLIAQGKIDDVVQERTKVMLDRLNRQIEDAQRQLKEHEQKANTYSSKYRKATLDNAIAQRAKGLADGALSKLQREAHDFFEVDDDGNIVAKDNAPSWENGNPVTIDTWNDYAREVWPFYFQSTSGSGAISSGNIPKGMTAEQFRNLNSVEKIKAFRKSHTR